MTEAEAQAWMARAVIVYTDNKGEQRIGLATSDESECCSVESGEWGTHHLNDEAISERTTLQAIADTASGG